MKRALLPCALVLLGACRDPQASTSTSTPAPVVSIVSIAPVPSSAAPIAVASSSAPIASSTPSSASAPVAGAPETGFVIRASDGTCLHKAHEYCCPPKALCKPTPEPKPVPCPPLANVKAGQKPVDGPPDAYTEMRIDRTCWTGPNPRELHRTLCCHDRYPDL